MVDSEKKEIEITEEMVAEGISAYHDWNELDGVRALVSDVYERMHGRVLAHDENTHE